MGVNLVWSAICFKIMTRYTCVFLPRILAFFPAFGGFYSQVYGQFLTNAYIYAHKKAHTYALQTSMWYTGSQKVVVYMRHRIIPSAKNSFMYKIWFLFIALTVVVVVGSPTTDLLESVDCLLRDCVRYFTNADRNNDRFS